MPTNKIEEIKAKAREDWEKFNCLGYPNDIITEEWWLLQLDSAVKAREDEIVEEIEKKKGIVGDDPTLDREHDLALSEIITLIKSSGTS